MVHKKETHVLYTCTVPEKSTMCVGTFSGVTSAGIVISSVLAGTCPRVVKITMYV